MLFQNKYIDKDIVLDIYGEGSLRDELRLIDEPTRIRLNYV